MTDRPGCNQYRHKCPGGGAHIAAPSTTADHATAVAETASERRHRRATRAARDLFEQVDPESVAILRMDAGPNRGNLRLRESMVTDWADRSTSDEAYRHVGMAAFVDAVWGFGTAAGWSGDGGAALI